MNQHAAFLSAIRAAPDDDAPRLIYADWLEDHGEAARAEFIRVQCELARRECVDVWCERISKENYPVGRRCEIADECDSLRSRESKLLDTHIIIDERGPLQPRCLWAVGVLGKVSKWEFCRGLIESIQCTSTNWLEHADTILAEHPTVREVTLTTWPLVSFGDNAAYLIGRSAKIQQAMSRSHPDNVDTVSELLSMEWPVIKFNLPQININAADIIEAMQWLSALIERPAPV